MLPFAFDRSVPAALRKPISMAVAMWAKHLQLEPILVVPGSGSNCLVFRVAEGDHGDGFPFLSEGLKISHVVSTPGDPSLPEVHFNKSTEWKTGGSDPDIYTVALHEIGHAFGLAHSSDTASIMYPWYGRDRQILDSELARSSNVADPAARIALSRSEIVYNHTVEEVSLRDTRD